MEEIVVTNVLLHLQQLEVQNSTKKLPEQIYFQIFDHDKVMTNGIKISVNLRGCFQRQIFTGF